MRRWNPRHLGPHRVIKMERRMTSTHRTCRLSTQTTYSRLNLDWSSGKPTQRRPPRSGAAVGGIAQVTQDGSTVRLTLTPCSIRLPEVDERALEISDEAVGAIPAIEVDAEFELADGAYALKLSPSAFVAGAELDNALTDSLPMEKRDDRLVDVDQDDEVGITLKISGHSIYGSLRLVFSALMNATKEGSEWSGPAELAIDFFVVDDSVPFVDVQDKLDDALAELTVDEQNNRFRLMPLGDSTEVSCIGVQESLIGALTEERPSGE